jgi:hypothetical protein
MSHSRSIATLRKYSIIAWSASMFLAAFGIVLLLLFVRPALIGVYPDSTSGYEGNPIWLVFGTLFVILGMISQSIAYRWPRHLLHVLSTQLAKPMRLQIEVDDGSDHTQYYACLSDDTVGANPNGWRVGLWSPSPDIRNLIGHELNTIVYIDPQTAEPAVIEYANGYLWAMKGAVISCPASTSLGAPNGVNIHT